MSDDCHHEKEEQRVSLAPLQFRDALAGLLRVDPDSDPTESDDLDDDDE